jgi:hypothetical protein
MSKGREYDFVVMLKQRGFKFYNTISILLCVMAVAAFTFAMLQVPFSAYNWINVFLAAFIIFNLVIFFIRINRKDIIPTFKWSLFAAAFLWLLYPVHVPVIGIFYIIAAVLERQVKFPQEIGFSKEAVTFNTFPFKNYVWQQLKNVILKDNILTLDFKNNKIFQKETESDVSAETEKEFNEFCKQQLVEKNIQ